MNKLMKNMRYELLLFCFYMLYGVMLHAQESKDTLTSEDYHVQMPAHMDPVYNGPWRFVVMSVVLAGIFYFTYRYYQANKAGKDIWHDAK